MRDKARERRNRAFRETPAEAGGCRSGRLSFAAALRRWLPIGHCAASHTAAAAGALNGRQAGLLFAQVPAQP